MKIYNGFDEDAMEGIWLSGDEFGIKRNIWSAEVCYGHINRYFWEEA